MQSQSKSWMPLAIAIVIAAAIIVAGALISDSINQASVRNAQNLAATSSAITSSNALAAQDVQSAIQQSDRNAQHRALVQSILNGK